MPNAFVIECLTKEDEIYWLDNEGELGNRLTSPNLRKWKSASSAEKNLEAIKNSIKKEYAGIKKVSVVERSKEIQAALDEEEGRKFEEEFQSIRAMASQCSVINSGSVYRQMLLCRANSLVSLTEGDTVLCFPAGYAKAYEIVPIDKVGISKFSAGGITASRLTGDNCFLPNDTEIVDYFAAYARIQQFIKRNWETVESLDLIQISTAISGLD